MKTERLRTFSATKSNEKSVQSCRGGFPVKSNMVYKMCNNMVYTFCLGSFSKRQARLSV